jgi:hypothetical protein
MKVELSEKGLETLDSGVAKEIEIETSKKSLRDRDPAELNSAVNFILGIFELVALAVTLIADLPRVLRWVLELVFIRKITAIGERE